MECTGENVPTKLKMIMKVLTSLIFGSVWKLDQMISWNTNDSVHPN